MARYIDVDKLIAEYDRVHIGPPGGARKLMEEAPTADVAEVKHGEWIIGSDGYYPFCSECRYEPPFVGGKDMRTPYCSHCGAKMDGGRENDGKG